MLGAPLAAQQIADKKIKRVKPEICAIDSVLRLRLSLTLTEKIMNSTAATLDSDVHSYLHTLYVMQYLTMFHLGFLSVGTTLLNGFVLAAIYKDPLKCLRSPCSTLIAGLAIADFLTGILVEPLFVGLLAWGFHGRIVDWESFVKSFRVAEILAFITVNASFLVILGLAVVQYIGLAYPGLYQRVISPLKAKIAVACIFVYVTLFSLLPEVGAISVRAFVEVDLYLHTVFITVSLIVLYILMYFKHRELWNFQGPQIHQSEESEQQQQDINKELIKGTFILTTFLIITVFPYTVCIFVLEYEDFNSGAAEIKAYIAAIICMNIMFLKFLWDPVIFALRLKKYRQSLVFLFGTIFGCGQRNALPSATYHRDTSMSDFEGIDDSVA